MECPATCYLSLPENISSRLKEAMSSEQGQIPPHTKMHHDFYIIYLQFNGFEKGQVDFPSHFGSVLQEDSTLPGISKVLRKHKLLKVPTTCPAYQTSSEFCAAQNDNTAFKCPEPSTPPPAQRIPPGV